MGVEVESRPAPQLAARRGLVRWSRVLVLGAVIAWVPFGLGSYWLFMATTLGINFIAAAALNLLSGNTGQFSLGNAAFMAIGAYSGALLWIELHVALPFVFVGVAAAGALCGLVVGLPALRLHGVYLLMSSLAAHFLVVFLVGRYQVDRFGIAGVPYTKPSGWFGMSDARTMYFLVAVVGVVVAIAFHNLLSSGIGRAMAGVRERDLATACCGVSIGRTKLVAWALTSAVVAVAGLLQAMSLGIASSESYTLGLAISFVAMAIIGGMGSLPGSLIGALFVTATPEVVGRISKRLAPDPLSHSIWAHPFELQRIVYGLAIVVFILVQPDGLVGFGSSLRARLRVLTQRRDTNDAAA